MDIAVLKGLTFYLHSSGQDHQQQVCTPPAVGFEPSTIWIPINHTAVFTPVSLTLEFIVFEEVIYIDKIIKCNIYIYTNKARPVENQCSLDQSSSAL